MTKPKGYIHFQSAPGQARCGVRVRVPALITTITVDTTCPRCRKYIGLSELSTAPDDKAG